MKKEDLGQHFLTNEKILAKEIEIAKIEKEDRVIEIGAGNGRLTKEILKKTKNLTSFEIDEELGKKLKKEFQKNVVVGDAIKYSWEGNNKIVANIPYYLSEQIIIKAIKENVNELVLIVGEKFKEILEKKKGNIGEISGIFFDFYPISIVPKEDFSPKPRVDSWLIKLKRKNPDKEERILQNVFLRKGKIKNAILYSLVEEGLTKNESREMIKKINLSEEILGSSTRVLSRELLLKIKESLTKTSCKAL